MLKINRIHDYLTLCKPKVVLLMLITSWVGMYLASPKQFAWHGVIFGTIGIAFAAGSAAIMNHLLDRHIDTQMLRTAKRPIASGRISPQHAITFATVLACCAWLVLINWVNTITAILTFSTMFGYAIIYTLYLKRATPQNIVIGGLSGAMPPLLGWAAISGDINAHALVLVLIIFTWTPPHFWALAIYRVDDYANANIPMLPVTHGVLFTKFFLLMYSILLALVSILPYIIGMSGLGYLTTALILNIQFLNYAIKLFKSKGEQERKLAIKTFKYSLAYLTILFSALVIDHKIGS